MHFFFQENLLILNRSLSNLIFLLQIFSDISDKSRNAIDKSASGIAKLRPEAIDNRERGVPLVGDVFNNPPIFRAKADRSTLMSRGTRHGGHDNKIMYATLRTIAPLTASLRANRA